MSQRLDVLDETAGLEQDVHEVGPAGMVYTGPLTDEDHWLTGTVYPTRADAEAAIDRLSQHAYDDWAVLFHDTSDMDVPESAATKRLAERLDKAEAKLTDYLTSKGNVWNRKTAYVTCPNCGSRLSLDALSRRAHGVDYRCCDLDSAMRLYEQCNRCICGFDLRTTVVKDRCGKLAANLRDLDAKLADSRQGDEAKASQKAPVRYLARWEVHC